MKFIKLAILIFGVIGSVKAQYFPPQQVYHTISGDHLEPIYTDAKYTLTLDSVSQDTQYYSFLYERGSMAGGFLVKGVKYNQGKVWGPNIITGKSDRGYVLYFDFNANAGDTLFVAVPGLINLKTMDSLVIDSVVMRQYGTRTLKTQYVRNYVFVDSIGSLANGIFFNMNFQFEYNSELMYVCRDNELLYWRDHPVVKSGANSCEPVFFRSSIGNVVSQNQELVIYPNPVLYQINFGLDDFTIYKLEIFNSMGQLVQSSNVYGIEQLNVNDLSQGIYYVQMYDMSRRQTYHGKFFKCE